MMSLRSASSSSGEGKVFSKQPFSGQQNGCFEKTFPSPDEDEALLKLIISDFTYVLLISIRTTNPIMITILMIKSISIIFDSGGAVSPHSANVISMVAICSVLKISASTSNSPQSDLTVVFQ